MAVNLKRQAVQVEGRPTWAFAAAVGSRAGGAEFERRLAQHRWLYGSDMMAVKRDRVGWEARTCGPSSGVRPEAEPIARRKAGPSKRAPASS